MAKGQYLEIYGAIHGLVFQNSYHHHATNPPSAAKGSADGMNKTNSGTAYILWMLCLFGICGGQRFYTGNIVGGLLYLFTFGFLGIGQLIGL